MKRSRRCVRIFILFLLTLCVFVPVFLLSGNLKYLHSDGTKDVIEDLSTIKHQRDALQLSAIEQEQGEGLREPPLVLYKDRNYSHKVSFSSSDTDVKFEGSVNAQSSLHLFKGNGANYDPRDGNQQSQPEKVLTERGQKQDKSKRILVRHDQSMKSQSRKVVDEKVKEMKDQAIMAKAYLSFTPPNSNSHLVKELKLRIKELERAVGGSTKDSDLSRSSLQKMRAMDTSLLKASRIYPDCSAMAKRLRAMAYNAEEQIRTQKNQAAFLVGLAGRTTPKGLHCLSMRLTAEYFALQPHEQELPHQHKLHDSDLHHYAVFSDNVLACSVVVNSTVATAKEPERLVFHIVTDPLNLASMSMWFLLNPPGEATIHIQSLSNFEWLSTKYNVTLHKKNSLDPRFTSPLNHLRFYLPEVFPLLNKIVLLDHDVVVQRDLTGLWSINMKGKVNGAVEICKEGEPSYRRLDMFLNFSDPIIGKKFNSRTCAWAFGMNLFDLKEWRRQNLTGLYHRYLHLGYKRPLWKSGSLPLGWITFYNRTMGLDKSWHVLGLGYESGVTQTNIEQAAVIHYDGTMKPWLDIGLEKYKRYWRRHVKYDHPYLQQCNVHES